LFAIIHIKRLVISVISFSDKPDSFKLIADIFHSQFFTISAGSPAFQFIISQVLNVIMKIIKNLFINFICCCT